MKLILKPILFILMILFSIASYAQVGGIQYTPYVSGRSSVQKHSSIHSVAAYMVKSGQLQRIQIRVAINEQSYGNYQDLEVVAYYHKSPLGSSWQNIAPVRVQQCIPPILGQNLESQFMYKAWMGTNWLYFDL